MARPAPPWRLRDLPFALFLLACGGLVTTYGALAMRRGMPAWLWALAWVLGPLLLLLGGNGTVRALRRR